MVKEFREFLTRGNLVEIAVGLVLALAFTEVVNAFVDGIISPLVGSVLGVPSFADKVLTIGEGQIRYGVFINAVLNFVIVGFVLFLIVKAYNKAVAMSGRGGEGDEDETPEDIALLREIRDALTSRP